MKAIVQERYGSPDDLELREVEIPAIADDEVLVRVRAASLHPDVWHVVCGRPYVLRLMGAGFFRPKNPIRGTDMAGIVESAGKVIITPGRSCTLNGDRPRGQDARADQRLLESMYGQDGDMSLGWRLLYIWDGEAVADGYLGARPGDIDPSSADSCPVKVRREGRAPRRGPVPYPGSVA